MASAVSLSIVSATDTVGQVIAAASGGVAATLLANLSIARRSSRRASVMPLAPSALSTTAAVAHEPSRHRIVRRVIWADGASTPAHADAAATLARKSKAVRMVLALYLSGEGMQPSPPMTTPKNKN